jgi:hypothetical protein
MEPDGSLPCSQKLTTGPYPIHFPFQRIRSISSPCVTFDNKISFYGEEMLAHSPKLKLQDFPLSTIATAYSTYSQPPSILGGSLLHPQPEDASRCGDRNPPPPVTSIKFSAAKIDLKNGAVITPFYENKIHIGVKGMRWGQAMFTDREAWHVTTLGGGGSSDHKDKAEDNRRRTEDRKTEKGNQRMGLRWKDMGDCLQQASPN